MSNIPESEQNQFTTNLSSFSRGEVILLEGATDDGGFYLLQEGSVTIYKKQGDVNQLMGSIEAVNFFGEMALMTGGARSATVIAQSDEVRVYKLHKDDLKAVITNPVWGELLITRLIGDLKLANEQIIKTGEQAQQTIKDQKDMVEKTALIVQAYHEFVNQLTANPPKTPGNLTSLAILDKGIQIYIKNKFPGVLKSINSMQESALSSLEKNHYLPANFNNFNQNKK